MCCLLTLEVQQRHSEVRRERRKEIRSSDGGGEGRKVRANDRLLKPHLVIESILWYYNIPGMVVVGCGMCRGPASRGEGGT